MPSSFSSVVSCTLTLTAATFSDLSVWAAATFSNLSVWAAVSMPPPQHIYFAAFHHLFFKKR